jgi:hypothetical protein
MVRACASFSLVRAPVHLVTRTISFSNAHLGSGQGKAHSFSVAHPLLPPTAGGCSEPRRTLRRGLGHVEVLEGVELPHTRGGGDGEQEIAGLCVGVSRLELDPAEGEASLVEQVADITKAEEGPENVFLCQGGGASALESEHRSVLRERGHLDAGFSRSVPVYLSQTILKICFVKMPDFHSK